MIIDFRVRAPFPAYAASPLFTHLDAVERDTRTRVDAPSPASARAFSLDLLLREADEAGVDKLVVPVRKAAGGRNEDLVALLQRHPDRLIGLAGIDTRRLTRKLRNAGVMNGIIYTEGSEPDEKAIQEMKAYLVKDAVKAVTCDESRIYPAEGEMKYRIALYDYGVKYNIERELQKRGCEVVTIPALTPPEEVAGKFDGVMLSNGPGDPAENVEIIENLKRLLETNIPIFGICLGHQLLSLAIGAKTTKLKYGHRGVNHPVKDLDADRTYITSQNHGYAVVGDSVDPKIARVRYVNLNDGTVEGVEHIGRPVFTVQYHPEVCPGPMDTSYLFDKFIENIENAKGGAQ